MDKPVPPELLHQGAFFTLQQAGHLLRDAALLYENGRWPTALVLSVASIEEVGKFRILLENMEKTLRSELVTRNMLKAAFKRHPHKLRYGLSAESRVVVVGGWGKWPEPDTPEMDALMDEFRKVERMEKQEAPTRTHKTRMDALYVDLSEDLNWIRPSDITRPESHRLLAAAHIEYHFARKRFTNPSMPLEQRLLASMQSWLQALPEPPDIK
jgi:AbiV family abortive infection protein